MKTTTAVPQAHRFPRPLGLTLLIAVAAAGWLAWLTPWGLGASPDSVTYLSAAVNLLRGHGLAEQVIDGRPVPMTQFPPLYPVLLAVPGLMGFDLFDAARWLGAATYAINVMLIGLLIRRAGGGGVMAVAGAALSAIFTPVAHVHLWVWSEPFFLALALGALWALGEHLERPRWGMLLTAAALSAAALLCRYAGLALLLAGLTGLLMLGPRSWRARIAESAAYLVVSLIPIGAWFVRNQLVAGTTARRELSFHPVGLDQLRLAAETVSTWVLPAFVPGSWQLIPLPVRLTALVVAAGLLLWLFFRERAELRRGLALAPLMKLLLLFVVIYPIFLLLSITFVDAHTPLDNRILSPWAAAGLVLILSAAQARLATGPVSRTTAVAGSMLLASVLLAHSVMTGLQWWQSRAGGFEYSSAYWRLNPGIRFMELLGPEAPVFTNGPDVLRLYFPHRPVESLPVRSNPTSQRENPLYVEQVTRMLRKLAERGGVIIYFDAIRRPYLVGEDELTAAAPMRVTALEGVRFYQLIEPAPAATRPTSP